MAIHKMKVITLLFHDVYVVGFEESGFQGNGPNSFKIQVDNFRKHITAIGNQVKNFKPVLKYGLPFFELKSGNMLSITFDDGGSTSLSLAAPILEEAGLRATFFITTRLIGQPGFMSGTDIKELVLRGHAIGSHSHTHPKNISLLPEPELDLEWEESARILQELLGEKVETASIPAGFYSANVKEAVFKAGYSALFNSEPQSPSQQAANWPTVLGRHSIEHQDGPDISLKVIEQNLPFLLRERWTWDLKKLPKKILGKYYWTLREKLKS